MAETRKKRELSDLDRETIMQIAAKAKKIRIEQGYSYEDFATHAKLNHNTYFKFEKAAKTGENFTINKLVKVLRGLDQTLKSFFKIYN